MNIIVTGGHLTPAYSFIEEAKKHQTRVSVIGASGANSLESQQFAILGCAYHPILPVKYNRYRKIASLIGLPLIIIPIIQAFAILARKRPRAVLVFGSFTAVPVAIAAKLLRIPLYLHEQTRTVGLANRIVSRIATACAASYPDSLSQLPAVKTTVIGNLIRQAIWHPAAKPTFSIPPKMPLIFVTGGNQGSAAILASLDPIITTLTKHFYLIIQHGNSQPPSQANNSCLHQSWFDAEDIAWLLTHASIIITRGGANTTAEIMVAGTPSIIIPLPNASQDEQMKNAAVIARHNAGIIIPQSHISPTSLLHAIQSIQHDYPAYQAAAKSLRHQQHPDAAAKLYQLITSARP